MEIVKGYTTYDLLRNKPCELKGICTLYPIMLDRYDEFAEYSKYLSLGKKHLRLPRELAFLDGMILLHKSMLEQEGRKSEDALVEVLEDLCAMFSMCLKKNIYYGLDEYGFYFEDIEKTIMISEENFDKVRVAICRINLIKEPKFFDDEYTQYWYQKALKAREKAHGKAPEMDDIILTVSQDLKIGLEEISKTFSVFQLYAYYARICHVENARMIAMARAFGGGSASINFSDGVIESLFKDDDSDLYVSMDEITGKL